ncbi:hypothetical protein JG687_00004407 [Phytophthora cactorum]|uniref:Uncharacterized protein n=1 Tax=Phytophthora cactorum TaxID=29920 RepID=A0A8T1UNU6_9STRA|nr:hypothetical protein JG687_00004407 [Phytophthora cactorum]
MVTSAFEAELALEGATGSAEAQLAFQEEFALAESVAAKLQLVHKTFVPGTPDFWFYSSLCTLLEVQTLLETEKYEAAWQMLGENKMQLEMVERELTGRSCWRRAQRIHRRRLLLELDVLFKLKRPQEEIESVTQLLTTALQVNYQDPEPAGVTTEIRKETYPTVLMPELLELDALIENRLNLLSYSTAKDSSLKGILRGLDVYGREKVFQKILTWNGSEEEHWTMLEVFLDDYPFEYADIPGYVDIIVKDVRRKRDKDPVMGCSFNFRAVHRELSFSQLLECARQDSELFRSNSEFAVRGMQLLRAAAEVDSEQSSDLRSEAQSEKELQHLATYVEFLRDFAPLSVGSIQVMVLYRKLQLLNVICCSNAKFVTELLNSLVEYVKIAGGRTLSPFGYVGSCGFDGVYQANHDDIIRKSLGTLWSSAIDEKAVFSALSNYLDTSILDVQHALTMIKCGKGMFSEWTEKLKANSQVLPSGLSAPQLVFCESNPTYFLPEDPLRVYVRTRNVKSLTAHLYEIKTMEYYSRLRREIKGDICLDGLLPTEEQVVDLSHLTQWQESRVSVEFLATRKSQRGVFVVEVFEKGMTCRAILRKGFLRHVERITTQGHEFMVLDEHGNLLRDARALVLNVKTGGSRAQHGREYTPDEKGSIIIPFRHPNEGSSSDKFAIAFCHGSFGYFHGAFSYLAESFSVDVDMHIDTEQLLPGFIAQLVTRPRLLVAGLATGEPLDLIVDLKVVIEFDLVNTSNVGSSSHKEILSFVSMQEIVNNPPCFEIPMDAQSFNVTLEGRVSQPHLDVKTGDLPKVSDSKRFEVQRVDNFDSTTETTEVMITESYVMESDDDFGVRSLDSESDNDDSEDDVDGDGNAEEEAKQKRKKLKQDTPYIPPGKVRKEYAEHLLRARTGAVRFVSSYFPEALVAITEGLFALAVLDLDIETKPTQVQLSSSAECTSTANSVLILKQRIQDENGDSNPELLVNKVYTTVVTLSNIGSEHLTNVNLLLQIPQGAIPMGSSGFYTKNEIGNVAPNHTSEFKFSFYFPEVGVFAQYPARASLDGVVIAWATIQEDGATSFLEEYDAFEKQSLRQHQGMEMIDDAMEGDQKNREAAAGTRGSQIKLEASVGEGAIVLLSQCIGQCELAFYPIDVELMFSTEPFNTFSDSAASASSILLVEPRQQLSVNLNTIPTDTSMAKTVVQIPDELNGAQMMVRIRELPSSRLVKSVAPPINIILPYFNSSLKVDIMTQCGILQVLRDSLPVRSCYVKVYAKVSSVGGRTKTEFYKDGYTDLLGKFDYVGINGDLISSVEKFSILISHDKFGARVEQAEPPVLATSIGDFTHKDEHELLLY